MEWRAIRACGFGFLTSLAALPACSDTGETPAPSGTSGGGVGAGNGGSGATGAVNKLIDVLNLRVPADLDARYRLTEQIPPEERPVVFIGPYEHHSNELPWRESIAHLGVIDEDPDGRIDEQHLRRELRR